ncbi:hypothetical protein D910_00734 [Dendroctonus ponderosae]
MYAATVPRLAQGAQKVAQQTRNMSVLSGPPTVRISGTEKLLHGLAIAIGMTATPAWVLVNIKHYKGSS